MKLRSRRVAAGVLVVTLLGAVGAGAGVAKTQLSERQLEPLVINGELIASPTLLAQARGEGSFTAYFSYPLSLITQVLDAFKKDTGISYTLFNQSSGPLGERILTEFGAGKLEADVISLSEYSIIQQLLQRRILAPYKVPNWRAIPTQMKDPSGRWYVEAQFALGFAYNKALLKYADVPKSWRGLLRPDLDDGKISMFHAFTGGAGWTLAMFQRTKFGRDYWVRLAAQDVKLANSAGESLGGVVRGENYIALVNYGSARSQSLAGAPIGFYFPKEGVPSLYEAVGLASTAKNPAAAKVYLNWVMSKRGARTLANITGEYTAFADVRGPSVPPLLRARLWVPKQTDYLRLRDRWLADWARIFKYNP